LEELSNDHRYETGYVYFIQADGAVKIGSTVLPPRERMAGLQTAHHGRLRLIGVIDLRAAGAEAAHRAEYARLARTRERQIQRMFSGDRLHGEWFTLTDGLSAFIRAECNVRLPGA
jgi:hypothetical protein